MNESKSKNLLLADNDVDYRHSLRALLELDNWRVDEADSVRQAVDKMNASIPDLILVDLRLSNDKDDHDISGLEVAKKASEGQIPCIIITAFPTVEVTRLALRSRGAFPLALDFVIKAAGPQAILDAIKIVSDNSDQQIIETLPELKIDSLQKLAWYKNKPLSLSRYQYTLMNYLYQKAGVLCTPEELVKAVYNETMPAKEAASDKRLEHLIDRLREKIENDPSNPRHLIKVLGRGFRLVL